MVNPVSIPITTTNVPADESAWPVRVQAESTRRSLIYLLCFGAPAFGEMTKLCVRSLRTIGKFEGDILVFTDGSFETNAHATAARVPPMNDSFAVKCYKTSAAQSLDVSAYDQVAVMDTDMVAVSDIRPLFGGIGSDEATVFGMSEFPFNTMLAQSCGGDLLDLHERERASTVWGINTGFLCSGSTHFKSMTERWLSDIERHRGDPKAAAWRLGNHFADQPYFNVLSLRGAIRFQPYPRDWLDMPPMYGWFNGKFDLKPCTKLLHFCGTEKEEMLARMRACVHALEQGRPREEIVRISTEPYAGGSPDHPID